MRIRWTPAAVADLQHISDYLKEHHPHYRQPTVRKLYEAIRSLKTSPHRGRPGREVCIIAGRPVNTGLGMLPCPPDSQPFRPHLLPAQTQRPLRKWHSYLSTKP